MIDRSRKHRLNASCQCCRLGEARPFRGAVFLRIRAADRAGSPSESSIRFVSWSFRPQAASGGRGASPPVPRPAGCRRRRRLRRLDFYFIIFRSASASFRPQLASGGRGASPPDPRPGAGADGGSAALTLISLSPGSVFSHYSAENSISMAVSSQQSFFGHFAQSLQIFSGNKLRSTT